MTQVQLAEMNEKTTLLEKELEITAKKKEDYEIEIARQSKQILKLQETLKLRTEETEKDIRAVQQEALEQANDWKVERQTLQDTVGKQ